MMTSKHRATLRSMAQQLRPIFHIGKGGINDNMVRDIISALEAHELIKIDVLRACELTAKEIINDLAMATGSEPIQAIGGRIVLYKRSTRDDVKHIEF
ncbi:MAG: ribosome assembly RNA-binding protein YhbY [Clostridia bacterium]|nr:ribosome assembly RNA-binding protein YhbY [Clostridia bacterium]